MFLLKRKIVHPEITKKFELYSRGRGDEEEILFTLSSTNYCMKLKSNESVPHERIFRSGDMS